MSRTKPCGRRRRREGPFEPEARFLPRCQALEIRVLPSIGIPTPASTPTPTVLNLSSSGTIEVSGTLSATTSVTYDLHVPEGVLLDASSSSAGLHLLVSDASGNPLLGSAGQSIARPTPEVKLYAA